MLTILGWLFIGFFAGSIGQAFRPENESEEADTIDGTVLIGICGAFIGGLIGGSPFRPGQGNAGFVISLALGVLGSVVVLSICHLALGINFAGFLSSWASSIKDRRSLVGTIQTARRSAVAPNPEDIGGAV